MYSSHQFPLRQACNLIALCSQWTGYDLNCTTRRRFHEPLAPTSVRCADTSWTRQDIKGSRSLTFKPPSPSTITNIVSGLIFQPTVTGIRWATKSVSKPSVNQQCIRGSARWPTATKPQRDPLPLPCLLCNQLPLESSLNFRSTFAIPHASAVSSPHDRPTEPSPAPSGNQRPQTH